MPAARRLSRWVLMLALLAFGICASVALLGWQAPLVYDQIVADE